MRVIKTPGSSTKLTSQLGVLFFFQAFFSRLIKMLSKLWETRCLFNFPPIYVIFPYMIFITFSFINPFITNDELTVGFLAELIENGSLLSWPSFDSSRSERFHDEPKEVGVKGYGIAERIYKVEIIE